MTGLEKEDYRVAYINEQKAKKFPAHRMLLILPYFLGTLDLQGHFTGKSTSRPNLLFKSCVTLQLSLPCCGTHRYYMELERARLPELVQGGELITEMLVLQQILGSVQ